MGEGEEGGGGQLVHTLEALSGGQQGRHCTEECDRGLRVLTSSVVDGSARV